MPSTRAEGWILSLGGFESPLAEVEEPAVASDRSDVRGVEDRPHARRAARIEPGSPALSAAWRPARPTLYLDRPHDAVVSANATRTRARRSSKSARRAAAGPARRGDSLIDGCLGARLLGREQGVLDRGPLGGGGRLGVVEGEVCQPRVEAPPA